MKPTLLLSLILLTTFSCKQANEKINDGRALSRQIASLKAENKALKESLESCKLSFLMGQNLLGISDECEIEVGKRNRINMQFFTAGVELPEYDIYKVEGKNETKIGSNTKTKFVYHFTPKSADDNYLNLKVKLNYNGRIIEYPAGMYFKVKK